MQTKRMSQAVLGTALSMLVLSTWGGEAQSQGQMQMPPEPANVLIIVLDDVGVDMVNCYWEHYPQPEMVPIGWELVAPITPNIDALAAAGTRFTNAWSSPVCTPTRAQIISGLRPSQTGMGTAFNRVDDPDVFGLAPESALPFYAANSAAVGKWHLAGASLENFHPCGITGFGSFLGTFYNVNVKGDATTGCADEGPYMCWNRFDCSSSNPERIENYATAQTTEDAVTKLDELDAGNSPWLLYVAYHASHAPYHCPPTDGYRYESGWIDICDVRMGNGFFGDPVYQTRAMAQAMDFEIGRLLERLDILDGTADGNYSNTAVILVGDNGTPSEATVAPFRSAHAKATVYQGGINVPLIIRAAGAPMPQVSNALASATDIFATTVQFLQGDEFDGLTEPDGLDSRSLAHLVDGDYESSTTRDIVYSESFSPIFTRIPNAGLPDSLITTQHLRAVRNSKYKLLDWQKYGTTPVQGGKREFYLLYDPSLGEAPQDPADLAGEFGEGYSSLHSPMEDLNILGLDPSAWPLDAAQAYIELALELDINYPPLPGGGVTPAIVRSADGASCSDSEVYVSRDTATDVTRRVFLKFNIPANIEEVYSAHLFVTAVAGGGDPSRTLKIWPVDESVSAAGNCGELFNSIDPVEDTPYGEADGWTSTHFGNVIHLAGSANQRIEDAADLNGYLWLGITLGDESQDYSVRLQPVWGTPISGLPKPHRLILRYKTSSGLLKTAEIPATPTRENTLAQSYPNPFNPSTTISYTVKEPSHVSLRIFDVSGALVRTLVNGMQPVGYDYSVIWDGRNDAGKAVSSGVYFYRLAVGDFVDSKKMVLLK